jgi:photosystem II stability/assembly factor-like uncharacterized protein
MKHRGKTKLALAGLCALLSSCLFETKYVDPSNPGFLSLELHLAPNSNALLKSASADTLFKLDSLVIELSSPGAATASFAYAIGGRPDTGNITVTSKIYSLAPLRTWKARILTIDTALNPARKDTVHLDSVSFSLNPGDTTVVSKTVNPVFAILKARLVSNSPGSLTNNVKYVRIRVDGTTRDSSVMGQTLHSIDYGSSSTGYAVGDSGLIIKTTNTGVNWSALTSGTTQNLNAVAFPGTNNGYAVGNAGTALKTTTGTSWTPQTTGTTQNLNGAYFTGTSAGYAVGNAGTILISNGSTWTAATSSGTTNALNGVYSTSGSTGYAVGNSGTIVKTTNNGANWSALTSGTARNLNAVHFPVAATGYAVGDSGLIIKTTNSGANWTALSSGTAQRLRGVFFTAATTGYAVGDGGTVLQTTNGTSWTPIASGTTQDLLGLGFSTNNSGADAVGKAGAMLTSAGGSSWSVQWVGAKSFDVLLTYKYFKPNTAHSLIIEAIDTLAGTLRGYQAVKSITLSPGKDTTLTPSSSLAKCGYSGFSACTP